MRQYLNDRVWNATNQYQGVYLAAHQQLHGEPSSYQTLLLPFVHKLTNDSLATLDTISDRLSVLTDMLGANTLKFPNPEANRSRGIINLGGDILKWLFGTPNNHDLEKLNSQLKSNSQDKLEIIHALEDQATVVAETFHQTTLNTDALLQLRNVLSELDRDVVAIRQESIESSEFTELMMRIEYVFSDIRQRINRMEQYVDSLSVAFSTLVLRRLPPGLFPPKKLQMVLESIAKNLPPTWTLAIDAHPTNLWVFYEEIRVSTALALSHHDQDVGMKLFLHIPIYELKFQFSIHQVFNLPIYNKNTSHGLQYENLPDYLAISKDQESYTTLEKNDLDDCIKTTPIWICPIKRAYRRILNAQTCVLSLFLNYPEKNAYCTQILVPWEGTYSFYLGNHKWLYSDQQDK